MKKHYIISKLLFLLLPLIFPGMLSGQSTANYVFNASTNGSLVDMSSGTTTVVSPTTVSGDFRSEVLDIGFPFVFMGTMYTQYSVNSNGLLRLGPVQIAAYSANNLNATANMPHIAPFWVDLNNTNDLTSKVHTKILGSAPNRILVIEFFDFVIRFNANVPSPASTFQTLLHESGKIEFIYGPMVISGGSICNASIGFAVAAANEKVLSVTSITNPAVTTLTGSVVNNLVNSSTVGPIPGLHSTENDSRVVFSFTPPPTPEAPSNLVFSDINPGSVTLGWTDNSDSETGFYIYNSRDGENFTLIHTTGPNVTSYTSTGLIPATTYHWKIMSFTEGGISPVLSGIQATAPAGQVISAAGGNWSDPLTWNPAAVPLATDNVTIAEGHNVTLDAAGVFNILTVNGNLNLQGVSLTGGELIVAPSGEVKVIAGTTANLTVTRNITNNGLMNFYTSEEIFGRITFSGPDYQAFHANTSTNLGNVTLVKGNNQNIAEIFANGNFIIKNGQTTGFLSSTSGTLKISGDATVENNVFPLAAINITAPNGFWLNNPNFTVSGQAGNVYSTGLFRLSHGTFNAGAAYGNNLGAGANAVFIIEGGTLNLASRFQTGSAITFQMSGGVINTNLIGHNTTTGSIHLTATSNTINISGGVINLFKPSDATNQLDFNLLGNVNISGGVINIGTQETTDAMEFFVQGNLPTLNINNTSGPVTVSLKALTNLHGNLIVNQGTTLNIQSHILNISGNTIANGNIINNGVITNSPPGEHSRIVLMGSHGQQQVSGTGSLGSAVIPFECLETTNNNGVNFLSPVILNRLNLINGPVSGAANITLGNGSGSFVTIQEEVMQVCNQELWIKCHR
jgi:hypothetical protein